MPDSQKPDRFKVVMTGVGAASACIGLFITLMGGVRWMSGRHQQQQELSASLAVAQSQMDRGEYEAAFASYSGILKTASHNSAAADGQLKAAMQWTESFRVSAQGSQSAEQIAASKLDQIMPVFDAALPQAQGKKKADILAHIGWAHWLNQKIAQREFGPAAEQSLRSALQIDPSNAYANVMLGNWMFQSGGDRKQAIAYFHEAEGTGKVPPFVRDFELGGLGYGSVDGASAETIRLADRMRKNGESLTADRKHHIFANCYVIALNEADELPQVINALPPEDALATYQWITSFPAQGEGEEEERAFLEANLLEAAGRKSEALAQFQSLQKKLKESPSFLVDRVNAAVKKLSGNRS